MAKQTINLGTAPSGAGGDTYRSALVKTQANMDELYANFVNLGLGYPSALNAPALNSVETFGFYYASVLTQGPTGEQYGWLLVQPLSSTYIAQTFTSAVTGQVWNRTKLNGTWSAWGRSVTSTNLVGTTSISGGLPTGAVIQSGNNANGFYTRYADGTQICTGFGAGLTPAATGISTVTWTYPIAFSSVPGFISLTGNVGAGADVRNYTGQATYNNASNTSTVFTTYMAAIVGCYVLAIGRWY